MLGRNRSTTGDGRIVSHDYSGGTDDSMLSAADEASSSDYNQWLHAMKLVARLPGGTPPDFRRKLWLTLADKYIQSNHIDWNKQQEKCFSEQWREDDEELGIQIVKDLHRTGTNLCTGPAGSINEAKLKRILLGYARYNPEVGYCQGFNMLGALILQVMEKEEIESMKVMIYLVEGVLPAGYFCGSMGGLQADMGVFRELMQTKLPRLAKHLQKLQGPVENAYEPPLTNVFTMQWFLTMFCTCLPMSCVLRVWDLVLIEGSDVLLRTAIVLWSLLEERVLCARSADEFYGQMGSFSNELLSGHLTDSNGLIEQVVQLGPINDLQKLRNKHLCNITPLRNKQGLQLYYDDDEDTHLDEDSRLAVATVWGLPWGRRGSVSTGVKQFAENKDRLALDISLLKKQYDRLRERQKQAHIILNTACSTASRNGVNITATTGTTPFGASNEQQRPVNKLLMGRSAIVIRNGNRIGPPAGALPPARKQSLPITLQTQQANFQRRDSITWKEIKADRAASLINDNSKSTRKLQTRLGKSDSSSYSEDSNNEDNDGSSPDISLCEDTNLLPTNTKKKALEKSNKLKLSRSRDSSPELQRTKSFSPTTTEVPFILMEKDSPLYSSTDKKLDEKYNITVESDKLNNRLFDDFDWTLPDYSKIAGDLTSTSTVSTLHVKTDNSTRQEVGRSSHIVSYINNSILTPMHSPKAIFVDSINSLGSTDGEGGVKKAYDVSDDGVINQYFECVNNVDQRTIKLEPGNQSIQERRINGVRESDPAESEFVNKTNILLTEMNCHLDSQRDNEIIETAHIIEHNIGKQKMIKAISSSELNFENRKHRTLIRSKTLTRSLSLQLDEGIRTCERRLSQGMTKKILTEPEITKCISIEFDINILDSTHTICELSTNNHFNDLAKQMSSTSVDAKKQEELTIEKQISREKNKNCDENTSEHISDETTLESKSSSSKSDKRGLNEVEKIPEMQIGSKKPSDDIVEKKCNEATDKFEKHLNTSDICEQQKIPIDSVELESNIKQTEIKKKEVQSEDKIEENTTVKMSIEETEKLEKLRPEDLKCSTEKIKSNNLTLLANKNQESTQFNKKSLTFYDQNKCKTENQSITSIKSFEDKCLNFKVETKMDTSKSNTEGNEKLQQYDANKRRYSEPTSSESNEINFEKLKRRMSTKTHHTAKLETVDEALRRIEHEVVSKTAQVLERDEKMEKCEVFCSIEELRNEKSTEKTNKEPKPTSSKIDCIQDEIPMKIKEVSLEAHTAKTPTMYGNNNLFLNARLDELQPRAFINELKSKFKEQKIQEDPKPSKINPKGKREMIQPMNDEILETPAKTAFYRSDNYEPWQQPKIPVRRFSDLPSRSDLEKRFILEKQQFKKFYKRRCASDSEIASRGLVCNPSDELNVTSKWSVELERRVQILEDQISEKSLKLGDNIRSKVAGASTESKCDSLQNLSTKPIDAAGREMVRYENLDDLEKTKNLKPINININIKMHLNKKSEEHQESQSSCYNNEDLRKRLETLENVFNMESVKNSTEQLIITKNEKSTIKMTEVMNGSEHALKYEHNEFVNSQTKEEEILNKIDSKYKKVIKEVHEVPNKNENFENITSDVTILKETKEVTKNAEVLSSEQKENMGKFETTKKDAEVFGYPTNIELDAADFDSVNTNNKTLILLMDNKPKAVNVRRLTRANTEELEDLYQAFDKQLSHRNLIKSEDGKLIHACNPIDYKNEQASIGSKDTTNLEIKNQKPTNDNSNKNIDLDEEPTEKNTLKRENEVKQEMNDEYNWGPNPVKYHLKRKTVYLPSTKELEARFHSLERQIKLLEDVEKMDVEKRVNNIERKNKLQFSLSHEKDLNKYLELCEGKGMDDDNNVSLKASDIKSPSSSPSRVNQDHSSISENKNENKQDTYKSSFPVGNMKKSAYSSPLKNVLDLDAISVSDELEYRYRILDLVRSKEKKKMHPNMSPIHPLEILLDPSPDEQDIPTTGELEHRIRILNEKLKSPTSRKPQLHSASIDDKQEKKMLVHQHAKSPVPNQGNLIASPNRSDLPTVEELEARMLALEQQKSFDFKTQKNYHEFNKMLTDIVSPSLLVEELKSTKTQKHNLCQGESSMTSKISLDDSNIKSKRDENIYYPPKVTKVLRFRDGEEFCENVQSKSSVELHQSYDLRAEKIMGKDNRIFGIITDSTKIIESDIKQSIVDSSNSKYNVGAGHAEGFNMLGPGIMRETSPISRMGTHTGVPLRTGENINDRLSSIKETIKSIDSLCEEKPFQNAKCQRYIDSLFCDSLHFAKKKSSLEDLKCNTYSSSNGCERSNLTDYIPPKRITSEPGSSKYRSALGSTESIHTSICDVRPSHYQSNQDLRRKKEREENDSCMVRRDNILPNNSLNFSSITNSYSNLTKFHKVDSQLNSSNKYDERQTSLSRPISRSPLQSECEQESSSIEASNTVQHNNHCYNQLHLPKANNNSRPHLVIERPEFRCRQPTTKNTTVYKPSNLEIRHTTVTSTFYDRLLTEKQIEKFCARPPCRLTEVSPSSSSKSYTDLPHAIIDETKKKHENQKFNCTSTATTALTTTIGGIGNFASIYSGASLSLPSQKQTDEIRVRSCENIIMQLKCNAEAISTDLSPPASKSNLALNSLSSPSTTVTPSFSDFTAIKHITTSNPSGPASRTPFIFTDIYKSYLATNNTTTLSTFTNTLTTSTSYTIGANSKHLMKLNLIQASTTPKCSIQSSNQYLNK